MIVWQIWHNGNPPKEIADCLATVNKDYADHIVLGLDEAKSLSKIHKWIDPDKLNSRPIPQQTNPIRFALLVEFGGLAIDADYISLKPFEPTGECCLYQRPNKLVSGAWMYAEPNHPLMEEALEIAAERANKGGAFPYWDWLGAHSITPAARKHEYQQVDYQLVEPVQWKEMGCLFESDLSEVERLDECYGVMLAQSSYKLHNLKQDSVIRQLLDRKLNDGC